MRVEFFRHSINQDDIDSVTTALGQIMLSTGDKTAEFETKFAAYMGRKRAVGVMSCTAALHLSLLACGIGEGDEVITTPMTFIATANAILHAGAKPVFVDVEADTGNLNAELVERAITKRTKAVLPVHLYGQMCDMIRLRETADTFGLVLIEDAAHAIESKRDGISPGQMSSAVCFSFYPTKSITSGEGGSVCTDDDIVADKVKMLRLHGMDAGAVDRYSKGYKHWDMETLGWKYNMDNIRAAMLVNQIDRMENNLERREQISRRYEGGLSGVVGFPRTTPNSKHGRHLFTIWVPPDRRDTMLHDLQDAGVGVAVNYRAIHLLSYYAGTFGYRRGDFPIAEKIGDSTISLPLYPKLTDDEVEHVIATVKECAKKWTNKCGTR